MSIPTSAVIRIILGQPDRLDRQGQPDPVPGLAELLELHGWSATGKLGTWSTTLTRPGDQPGSRRPPSDEEAGSTPHSDPTGNAATGHDPLREIDRQWERALSTAHGWACHISSAEHPSISAALRSAVVVLKRDPSSVGSLQVGRLLKACQELERILVMCRPDLTPPDEETTRHCPACRSPHEDGRIRCNACNQLHHNHKEFDDGEFNAWVQRRVLEGSISRPLSMLHRRDVA